MRTAVRTTLIAGLTGTLMVSAAWAGIGISPLPLASTAPEVSVPQTTHHSAAETPATAAATTAASPVTLGAGQLLVGAAKTPMTPRPDEMRTKGFPDARWETDPAKCTKMDQTVLSD